MPGMRLHFRKGDVLAIAAVVLLAALVFAFFLPGGDFPAVSAEIWQDGRLLKTVSLSEDQEFTVTGKYTNTIAVRDSRIAVVRSNCPGEDCIRCGWIGSTGRSIVCLPNGLEIRVTAKNSNIDFAVG